ncbi:MAG TPA: hypothetical protein VJ806_16805 [Luteimonas sp.]|nr:hypothetical protein [Luteimonas sp.]
MRFSLRSTLLVGAIAACCVFDAHAATTTLNVGEPLARADLLKPGVHRYLRYTVAPDGQRSTKDIWAREVRFENVDGKRQLRIVQRWDAVGEKAYVRKQDSRFEAGTMRPLTHTNEVVRDGKTELSGYRFLSDKVVGMDDLAGNAKRGFSADSPEPAYNFETDLEFLQSLPLAPGYEASIPFYDPGLAPPARYVFKVAGEDRLTGPDGRAIDCWLVTTDYNRPGYVSRFWFAKANQVLIRQESPLADGAGLLVKTLLPPEAADAGG